MFAHNWKEESEHAEKIMNYINKRGGEVKAPQIQVSWFTHAKLFTSLEIILLKAKYISGEMTVCQALEKVLALEKAVTEHFLEVIHPCARGEETGSVKKSSGLKEDPQVRQLYGWQFVLIIIIWFVRCKISLKESF